MKRIYLASPYTHPVQGVMEARFLRINRIAGELMQDGHLVFPPISHTHPIAVECELPRGYDFWAAYDRTFIEWADELWVYRGDGWEQSRGVKAEIAIATELGKPVRYL